jgi:hypothetical protein
MDNIYNNAKQLLEEKKNVYIRLGLVVVNLLTIATCVSSK